MSNSNPHVTADVSESLPRAPPAKLEREIPWVREVLPTKHDAAKEDYKINTKTSVVDMDRHIPTLENLGYTVERIGYHPPYGCRFYCTV